MGHHASPVALLVLGAALLGLGGVAHADPAAERCARGLAFDRAGDAARAHVLLDRCLATGIIGDSFLDGCYELGKLYPDLCSSIFAVCGPGSVTKEGA